MNPRNGVSPNESVPQECRTTIRSSCFKEKMTSPMDSESGICEDKGGTKRDASRKESIKKGKGMRLLGLAKGLCMGGEVEEIKVRLLSR